MTHDDKCRGHNDISMSKQQSKIKGAIHICMLKYGE